jgi:hypothetical protein
MGAAAVVHHFEGKLLAWCTSRIWEKRDLFSMMLMTQHDNDLQ